MKQRSSTSDYVLKDLHSLSGKPGMSTLLTDVESFFRENPLVLNLLDKAGSFFFLIDFARMQYIYVSDGIANVMGYTSKEWRKEGLEAAFRTLYHEDKLRLKKLHEDLFAFHFSLPLSERRNYRYTCNFRVVRKDGKVIWMFSQCSIIALDEKGNAAIAFEVCSDITDIKKDNTMSLSITKAGSTDSRKIEKKYFYPLEGTTGFSNREVQVLQHLYQGLTTKEIADALNISELTVSKHRMNMMKKANVTNAASLIHYGVKNNLL